MEKIRVFVFTKEKPNSEYEICMKMAKFSTEKRVNPYILFTKEEIYELLKQVDEREGEDPLYKNSEELPPEFIQELISKANMPEFDSVDEYGNVYSTYNKHAKFDYAKYSEEGIKNKSGKRTCCGPANEINLYEKNEGFCSNSEINENTSDLAYDCINMNMTAAFITSDCRWIDVFSVSNVKDVEEYISLYKKYFLEHQDEYVTVMDCFYESE